MKIVIVHDYLNQLGGAERVVAALHQLYPEARIHTLFVDRNKLWPPLENACINPTWLQRVPIIMKHFKLFFWFYPFIIKNINIRDSDVVISSSSAYAIGVKVRRSRDGTKPLHICYCHTPMRFAWDYDRYIENETSNRVLSLVARIVIPFLKWWDVRASRSVDLFIANSTAVQKRIKEHYNREATIIYPPVEMKQLNPNGSVKTDNYFLVVSRLVSYKRIELAIRACTDNAWPLVVIGSGPDRKRLQSIAGPTVRFLGFQSDNDVAHYMASCKALIFPGEEDFGITPLEVNSLGRPVVAYGYGGALDTVVEGVNGVLFSEPTVHSLSAALERIDRLRWDPSAIRAVAQRFQRTVFEQKIREFVERAVNQPFSKDNSLPVAVERSVSD